MANILPAASKDAVNTIGTAQKAHTHYLYTLREIVCGVAIVLSPLLSFPFSVVKIGYQF